MNEWTAWQAIEPYRELHGDRGDEADGESGEFDHDIVSRMLLIEMRRPPWYREIDRERRELAREAA